MREHKIRTIYGRRQSRPLRDAQKEVWQRVFDDVKIDIEKLPSFDHKEVIFEIGFGSGENLIHQAVKYRDALCIGCEPFINGVASLLFKIDEAKINNIKIVNDDAAVLLKALPDQIINKAFILFPDPWPKKRHNRRRIVNLENLFLLRQKMYQGGQLVIATDHPGYLEWMLEIFQAPDFVKHFKITHDPSIGRPNEDEIPITRYEKKALENRPGAFFKIKVF